MQALGLHEKARPLLDRATLGVCRPIIEPRDPRVGNRARTHGAGLQRHPQVASRQTKVMKARRSGAHRNHFRMGGRVAIAATAILPLANDDAVACHHRADRHLVRRLRRARQFKGAAHRRWQGKGRGHAKPLLHLGQDRNIRVCAHLRSALRPSRCGSRLRPWPHWLHI